MKIRLEFIEYRGAICATEMPGTSVWLQIDRFSSSDQNRFFWPFFPAMACLKMSIFGQGIAGSSPPPSERSHQTDTSLIAAAKISGVERFTYLKATLGAVAAGFPASRIDELLLSNFSPPS